MMSTYNRGNPMIEVLSKNYFRLKEKQKHHTKNIVKQNLIILVISILGFIFTSRLILLTAIPIYLVTSIWLLRFSIKSTPLNMVEEIFNGDSYKVQNINDEKIFELISKLMGGNGILDTIQMVLLVIFSVINMIIFMTVAFDLMNYLQSLIF